MFFSKKVIRTKKKVIRTKKNMHVFFVRMMFIRKNEANQNNYTSQPMAEAPRTAAEAPSRPLTRNCALLRKIFSTCSL